MDNTIKGLPVKINIPEGKGLTGITIMRGDADNEFYLYAVCDSTHDANIITTDGFSYMEIEVKELEELKKRVEGISEYDIEKEAKSRYDDRYHSNATDVFTNGADYVLDKLKGGEDEH